MSEIDSSDASFGWLPTQIVVTGELEEASQIWLGALSERMEKQM